MMKFCKDVAGGAGPRLKCLVEHKGDVSEACKKFIGEFQASIGAAQKKGAEACKADTERLCKDVQPGEGRVAKCFFEHWAELSKDCQARTAALLAAAKKKSAEQK